MRKFLLALALLLPFSASAQINLGTFKHGDTVAVIFFTYGSSNESITMSGIATTDIEVYKGNSIVQRASDAGYALIDTDGIDIDSTTGMHGFEIDTSDNTTADFWTPGAHYTIALNSITVDTQTVVGGWTFDLSPSYLASGLAQTTDADATTCRLPTAYASFYGDDVLNNKTLEVYTGAGEAETRLITDYTGTTGQMQLASALSTDCTTTSEISVRNGNQGLLTADANGVVESNMVQLSDDAGAADNAESVFDNSGYEMANSTVGTVTTLTGHTAQTGDNFARLGAPAGASVSADIAAIEAQTDDIGVAGAGLTAITGASVDELTATALADMFNTDSGTTYGAAVAGSVVKETADNAGGSGLTEAGIADAVWNEDATAHQTTGTFGQAIGDPVANTETIYDGIVTDAAGTNIAADIIVIEAQTDDIGVAGVGLTAVSIAAGGIAAGDFGANAITDAAVANDVQVDVLTIETVDATDTINAQADTALIDIGLDHLLSAAVTGTDVADNSIVADLVDDAVTSDYDNYINTTASLSALLGENNDTQTTLGPAVGANLSADIAAIEAQTDDIGVAGAGLTESGGTGDQLTALATQASVDALNDIAAGDVWAVDATGQQTAGTFGQAIGDPGANAETIFEAVVADAAGANIAVDIAAIEAQTDDIGAAGAGLTESGGTGDQLTALATQASVDTVDGVVDSILAAIGITEPSAVIEWATSDLGDLVSYMAAWYRNEVQQTSTTKTLRNDADSANLITCGVSDNGTTFQVDECVTAP